MKRRGFLRTAAASLMAIPVAALALSPAKKVIAEGKGLGEMSDDVEKLASAMGKVGKSADKASKATQGFGDVVATHCYKPNLNDDIFPNESWREAIPMSGINPCSEIALDLQQYGDCYQPYDPYVYRRSMSMGGWDIEGEPKEPTEDDKYNAHIQSLNTCLDLGREEIYELGRRGPYYKYLNFPVELKTDIKLIQATPIEACDDDKKAD